MAEETRRPQKRASERAKAAQPARSTETCLEAMRRLGMIDDNFNILPPRGVR